MAPVDQVEVHQAAAVGANLGDSVGASPATKGPDQAAPPQAVKPKSAKA